MEKVKMRWLFLPPDMPFDRWERKGKGMLISYLICRDLATSRQAASWLFLENALLYGVRFVGFALCVQCSDDTYLVFALVFLLEYMIALGR
jgi:hypothetical protein